MFERILGRHRQVAPMFGPGSGFLFTLFDFPVPAGTPATTEGTLTVEADNPSGLPQNDFRVMVPLTVGRTHSACRGRGGGRATADHAGRG